MAKQSHRCARLAPGFDRRETIMSRWMRGRTRGSLVAAFNACGVVAVLVLGAGPALADPDEAPGDPGPVIAPVGPPVGGTFAQPPLPDALGVPVPPGNPVAVPAASGPAAGQDPTPFVGEPPFRP